MQDLERVRYVSANYERLQGLRKVPIGLWLLALALFSSAAGVELFGTQSAMAGVVIALVLYLGLLAFVVAFFLYFIIREYYERRYGSVRRLPVSARRKLLYAAIILVVLIGGYPTTLLLGVTMLIAYWPERRFQTHYLMLAALIIVICVAPLVGFALDLVSFGTLVDIGWLLYPTALGLYFFIGGVLDHLLLVRTTKSLPEENGGGAV